MESDQGRSKESYFGPLSAALYQLNETAQAPTLRGGLCRFFVHLLLGDL